MAACAIVLTAASFGVTSVWRGYLDWCWFNYYSRVKIGKWSVMVGSVVTKDIPDNVLAAGQWIIKNYKKFHNRFSFNS